MAPLLIIPRIEWLASPYRSREPLPHPITTLIFSYWSGVELCQTPDECSFTVLALQKRHMEMGMPDIAYNFVVGGLGHVYEGRGWLTKPQPTKQFTKVAGTSLNIAFTGYHISDRPPIYMSEQVLKLIDLGIENKYIRKKHGYHEDRDNEFLIEPLH